VSVLFVERVRYLFFFHPFPETKRKSLALARMRRDLLLNLITKLKYLVRAFQGLQNLQKHLEYS